MTHYLDKSIAVGLLAVLVFTALAHGAVEPWSVALFQLLAIALLLLWAVKATTDGHLEITIPAAALPIGALLVLGIAQSVAFTNGAGERASLSMDVEATRHSVMVLFYLAVCFIVAANFFASHERLILLANVLTVFGAVVAAFALIQHFTWDGRFYWLRSTNYSGFGPFVNHNHFAGYMAMLAAMPLGLIVRAVRGHARLVYGFAAALMGTAAIVSGSRSGMISLAAAFAFMAFLNRRSRRPSRMPRARLWRIGPIALVIVTMIAGVVWIGATRIVERFGAAVDALLRSGTPDLGRAMMWRDTLEMIRDYPVLGAGLGTYHTVYPIYGDSVSLYGLDYAHNDYLQVIAETGIAGGIIAVSFIVVIFSAVSRGVRSRDPLLAGLSLAAGGGIFAVAVQSVSDTNLQVPSNALLFLVLAAIVSSVGAEKAGAVTDRAYSRDSR